MAYNNECAQRIREAFLEKGIRFTEKSMFGGLCFMVDDKMCCATRVDKKTGENLLMCRIGNEAYAAEVEKNYVTPMQFTGKVMTGYIYVLEAGFKSNESLNYWLQLCLDYNPLAKGAKK
jgi:hypothetical protein